MTTDVARDFAASLRESPSRGWRRRERRSEATFHGLLVDLLALGNWLAALGLLDRPLSPLGGATPTSAAICSRSRRPGSGSSASKLAPAMECCVIPPSSPTTCTT